MLVPCREPATKPVGKPDAGNPHVRFDERGGETDRRAAPRLSSTLPGERLIEFDHQIENVLFVG